MHNAGVRNGWESLPNGFDVEFRHSMPVGTVWRTSTGRTGVMPVTGTS